jgi:hypothetical protein
MKGQKNNPIYRWDGWKTTQSPNLFGGKWGRKGFDKPGFVAVQFFSEWATVVISLRPVLPQAFSSLPGRKTHQKHCVSRADFAPT